MRVPISEQRHLSNVRTCIDRVEQETVRHARGGLLDLGVVEVEEGVDPCEQLAATRDKGARKRLVHKAARQLAVRGDGVDAQHGRIEGVGHSGHIGDAERHVKVPNVKLNQRSSGGGDGRRKKSQKSQH